MWSFGLGWGWFLYGVRQFLQHYLLGRPTSLQWFVELSLLCAESPYMCDCVPGIILLFYSPICFFLLWSHTILINGGFVSVLISYQVNLFSLLFFKISWLLKVHYSLKHLSVRFFLNFAAVFIGFGLNTQIYLERIKNFVSCPVLEQEGYFSRPCRSSP